MTNQIEVCNHYIWSAVLYFSISLDYEIHRIAAVFVSVIGSNCFLYYFYNPISHSISNECNLPYFIGVRIGRPDTKLSID